MWWSLRWSRAGGQPQEPVGHRGGDDGVGEADGLAQDLELVAVLFSEQQVGAVHQGNPVVSGQGPQQGGGGIEREVLQVHAPTRSASRTAARARVSWATERRNPGPSRHLPVTGSSSSPGGSAGVRPGA